VTRGLTSLGDPGLITLVSTVVQGVQEKRLGFGCGCDVGPIFGLLSCEWCAQGNLAGSAFRAYCLSVNHDTTLPAFSDH
jgi:hypothetical protein